MYLYMFRKYFCFIFLMDKNAYTIIYNIIHFEKFIFSAVFYQTAKLLIYVLYFKKGNTYFERKFFIFSIKNSFVH